MARIIVTDVLDEAAVTRAARIRNNDTMAGCIQLARDIFEDYFRLELIEIFNILDE